MNGQKNRILHLDFIRIISCFLVIVNHTTTNIFLAREPSVIWFGSLTYFFISKPAVPLFIMTSGAVLIGRDEPIRMLLKRVLRIIIVIFAFSVMYFVDNTGVSALSFSSIPVYFSSVIKAPITNAFWYLYLYIGLLLMLPLLRRLITVINRVHYYYFFCISLLFVGVYPIINHYIPVISLSSHIFTPIFSAYIAMFVIGYYLHTHVAASKRNTLIAIGLYLVLLASQVICTYIEYLRNKESYLFFDNRTFITITMSSVCIFYVTKYIFSNLNLSRYSKAITVLGQCTLGIYLFSDLLMRKFAYLYSLLPSVCAVFIYQILIFSGGFVLTYILRKIPLIRKYV